MLDDDGGIENLFFSLSSTSRIDILNAISVETLKMNEIARKIDITPTEASRQIQRLLDEFIVQKLPDGSYILTNYGRLILHFFPSLDFIFKHKQYFLVHDIWRLPYQFINRLGELSQGNLCTEMAEAVNKIQSMMQSSDEYVWVITDQAMSAHSNIMIEQVSKGVKFRSLIHEKINSGQVRVFGRNVERRVLSTIPALVVITDKEALVSFLSMDGKIDYSGFFGSDPKFMKWITDLFLYYWDQTRRGYPQINPT